MNEILFIERKDDNDPVFWNTIRLCKKLNVNEMQKTNTFYILDFTFVEAESKLLCLHALNNFVDFNLSYPVIENLHDSPNLSVKIEGEITSNSMKIYPTVTDLTNKLGKKLDDLSYTHYIHFKKDSLEPNLIETKTLIDNLSSFTGDDFFFSVPYIKSLIFSNNNDDDLSITFVKIKKPDGDFTVALKIKYSNGIVKYGDISYNPPKGKFGVQIIEVLQNDEKSKNLPKINI